MSRPTGRCLLILCALSLGACSGDLNPVRYVAVKTGIGEERKEAPDFVKGSRPAQIDYTPVGVAAPPRAAKAKPAGSVKAVEAEMDALRAQNEAKGTVARQAGAAVQPAPAPPR